jgi:hypothetical protein
LIWLRKQLHEAEYQDYFHGNPSSIHYTEDLECLFNDREDDAVPEQWIIMEKIRRVLEKYSALRPTFWEVGLIYELQRSCAFAALKDFELHKSRRRECRSPKEHCKTNCHYWIQYYRARLCHVGVLGHAGGKPQIILIVALGLRH